MNIIKNSLGGLAFVLLGELVGTNLVYAQDASTASPIHDTSIVPVNQSLVDAAGASSGVNANFDSGTGTFSIEGLGEGGNVAFSPDVVQAIENVQGSTGGSITRRSTNDQSESGQSSGSVSASNITLEQLSTILQNDLQESVDNLVAAESFEKQPRRFARRRSSNQNCNCVIGSDGERKSLAQLQAEVDQKTVDAQNFVQQINKLDPENAIW